MSDSPPDLKTAVLHRVRQDGLRKVWTPADFLDLGSRDAVDKALQRLTKAEQLPRLLFKGGTSLSKGFELISRFSEDIDVTVFRDDIGAHATIAEPDTRNDPPLFRPVMIH